MNFSYLLLFAAGVPLLAGAQADRALPAAADPDAHVSPLQYQSVFADYAVAKEPAHSPDKGWIAANRALMGAQAEPPTANNMQPVSSGSSQTPALKPMPDKHEHKGAHQ